MCLLPSHIFCRSINRKGIRTITVIVSLDGIYIHTYKWIVCIKISKMNHPRKNLSNNHAKQNEIKQNLSKDQ